MAIEQTEADLPEDILENLDHPESLAQASPGGQLMLALSEIFAEGKPSRPPRRGKRLDTRRGEFAPLRFGTPAPTSLRDAWGQDCRIRNVFGTARVQWEICPVMDTRNASGGS